jgi:exosortase D (VPLPA-CTERM-specific)
MVTKQNEWLTPVTLVLSTALVAVGLAIFIYWEGVAQMVRVWEREEYSYAYLLPFVIVFFLWQKKNALAETGLTGSWIGFGLVLFALFMFVAGELGTLYTVIQYGFVLALIGATLALLGRRAFGLVAVPVLMLLFLVPLPNFLYNNLSAYLQLISSEWGVWVIRQFGIPVNLEGNVIDLGDMKLQVVEACSGLRYLFPLFAIGFVVAYVFEAPFWKRAVLVLSTIPITVLMNSLRIGLTGVAVNYWGKEVADDFMHYFEGWVVFMACLALLIGEMWVLNRIGGGKKRLDEVFRIEMPGRWTGAEPPLAGTRLPWPFVAVLALLAATAVATVALPERQEIRPARADLVEFPMLLGDWRGRSERMDQDLIDTLQFDDYLQANFEGPRRKVVNLYVAYYGSQQKGASVHSPRSCIPGGGWEIQSLDQVTVPGVTVSGEPLRVNRVQIQKGNIRHLTYYWFQQRGRVLTNEYLVKWYIFQDALTRRRTDGSLVRLTTLLPPGEPVENAEARLEEMARLVTGQLERYLPN